MRHSNHSGRPQSSFPSGLAVLLSCKLSVACSATPAASTKAPTPPATRAAVVTTSESVAGQTQTDWDFTAMTKWHLCDVGDLDECTAQCNRGHLPSCVRLAIIYSEGKRVPRDYEMAARLYDLPCEYHIGVACSNRASILAHNHDDVGAAEYFRRGCESDDPNGCFKLASMYEDGKGVAADAAHAAVLYQKACDGDDVRGCDNLGFLYLRGQGVAPDQARAVGLFKRACDAGNAWGCGNLGGAYQEGWGGVARDGARAKELRQRACDGGAKQFCASTVGPGK
jgi:TPR repeat protein